MKTMYMEKKVELEIGHKVRWSRGREERPIVSEGMFIEEIDDEYSLIMIISINGSPVKTKAPVLTELLEKI